MRTVEWDYETGRLRMIDQRKLPWEETIAEFDDFREVARSITEMYVRGAPAIGAAAAFGMVLAARQSNASDRKPKIETLKRDRISVTFESQAPSYPTPEKGSANHESATQY